MEVEYSFDEENKRDVAARIIQRKVRVRIARKNLIDLFKQSYVKVYDEVSDQYVYKNKFTLEISYDKPRLLGNDDLPSPRKLEAPADYNPGEENKEMLNAHYKGTMIIGEPFRTSKNELYDFGC